MKNSIHIIVAFLMISAATAKAQTLSLLNSKKSTDNSWVGAKELKKRSQANEKKNRATEKKIAKIEGRYEKNKSQRVNNNKKSYGTKDSRKYYSTNKFDKKSDKIMFKTRNVSGGNRKLARV
ncbi:MAG TPA: hypothetical protein VF691_16855 [Cytophagaceae bacterium]